MHGKCYGSNCVTRYGNIAKYTVCGEGTFKETGVFSVKHSNTRRKPHHTHRDIHVTRNIVNYIQSIDKHFENKRVKSPLFCYAPLFSIRNIRNFGGVFDG